MNTLVSIILLLFTAYLCADSLRDAEAKKKECFALFLITYCSFFLINQINIIVLIYLFTQAVLDCKDSYVDADLNLKIILVMSALLIVYHPSSIFAYTWIISYFGILYILMHFELMGSGDIKGLAILGMWGCLLSKDIIPCWETIIIIVFSNLFTVVYAIILRKKKNIPFFPGMFFGFASYLIFM